MHFNSYTLFNSFNRFKKFWSNLMGAQKTLYKAVGISIVLTWVFLIFVRDAAIPFPIKEGIETVIFAGIFLAPIIFCILTGAYVTYISKKSCSRIAEGSVLSLTPAFILAAWSMNLHGLTPAVSS